MRYAIVLVLLCCGVAWCSAKTEITCDKCRCVIECRVGVGITTAEKWGTYGIDRSFNLCKKCTTAFEKWLKERSVKQ